MTTVVKDARVVLMPFWEVGLKQHTTRLWPVRCDFRNERIPSRREVRKPEKTLPVCRISTFFSYYRDIFVKLYMFEFLYLFDPSTDRKSDPRKRQGT